MLPSRFKEWHSKKLMNSGVSSSAPTDVWGCTGSGYSECLQEQLHLLTDVLIIWKLFPFLSHFFFESFYFFFLNIIDSFSPLSLSLSSLSLDKGMLLTKRRRRHCKFEKPVLKFFFFFCEMLFFATVVMLDIACMKMCVLLPFYIFML